MNSSRGRAYLLPLDVVAAPALVLLIAYAALDPPVQVFTGPLWVAWTSAVAIALPVAVRRRWPLPVLAVTGVGAVVATLLGTVGAGAIWVAYVPAALALYLVALTTPPRRSVTALVACLLASGAAVAYLYSVMRPVPRPGAVPGEVLPAWPVEAGVIWAIMCGAWAAGAALRRRRATAARLSRQAVADERLHIARELHDIVGHSMSLIAVKATVANHIAATNPQEAMSALAVIEHTSRAALTDIRRLLGVLRSDEGSPADLAPPPGPAQLHLLAEHTRAAGVPVDLEIRGTGELPEAVGLSVYRIVQEALTNVVKHAAPARCKVLVETGGGAVRIEVVDDGRGRRPAEPRGAEAHGLVGMRERVTMYGGTFSAGPRPEGGFQVSAHLPYEPSGRTP
ncbi:sensor histidine kinase [Streptosporangium sp. NBC_01495]|uniref:sensor histidine kinase n=1 Tax=Streptosporangium sp. NBC_01495 TaxID=2903899 RepID=UPI002E3309E6|nr:sensor histidine kinase [Streptosporangium sp. NBC_01495]